MASPAQHSRRKASRAQLLVDLATGYKEKSDQNEYLIPPDVFLSSGYDPTNPITLHEELQLENDDIASNNPLFGTLQIEELVYQPLSQSKTGCVTHIFSDSVQLENNNVVSNDPQFEELQLVQMEEVVNLPPSKTGCITDRFSNSVELENNKIASNNPGLIQGERLILNEITGEITRDLEHIANNVNDYYLDEETGVFLLDNDEDLAKKDNISSDSEPNSDAANTRKNREVNKKNRIRGKGYTGRKRKIDEGRVTYDYVWRPGKDIKEKSCGHSVISNSDRSFLCGLVSENKRKAIFKYFWDLNTWDAKKAYLKNLVRLRLILRRRKTNDEDESQKKLAYDYYLPDDQNALQKVCKSFILATLNINGEVLSEWMKGLQEETTSSVTVEDLKSRHKKRQDAKECMSQNANKPLKAEAIKKWLSLLNKVPSHYCRASSTRVYVEESFESKSHMFREYESWCKDNDERSAGRKLFNETLEDENISIYKPRKDQCDICTGHKEGSVSEEQNALHMLKKNEAYKSHTDATAMSSSEVLVLTIDVQSVLLCPKMLVSVQYYKQKLQVHNQSIYVSNNKDVHLYVWHEGDGGVTANEFTSCIIKFIKSQPSYKKIIMVTDGCAYQNRNKTLSSALLKLSKEISVEIEQLILEKGHTMMPVDSVHSTLEKKFRPPIYSPSDYISRMREARPKQPYHVHHVDYNFFKNYEEDVCLDSIRPGKKSGDPTVNDIRGLLYKNGEIYYKLRHPDEWKILPQRVRSFNPNSRPNKLYNEPRKIEKSKFESLQSLKPYMHRDYHAFYDNLCVNRA